MDYLLDNEPQSFEPFPNDWLNEPVCRTDALFGNERGDDVADQEDYVGDNAPDIRRYLCQEDQQLYDLLVSAGFNMQNLNMKFIQLINSLQLSMEVLEKAIFSNCPSPIFAYGIDFTANRTHSQSSSSKSALKKVAKKSKNDPRSIFRFKSIAMHQQEIVDLSGWQSITSADKLKYLSLRKQIDELKSMIAKSLITQQGDDCLCVVCGAKFDNGRQLGGHMSRKHPGNSTEYSKKKKIQSNKAVEKERRDYFHSLNSDLRKTKPIQKSNNSKSNQKPCLSFE